VRISIEVCRAAPHSQRKSQAMIDSSGSDSEMQRFESSRLSHAVGLWASSRQVAESPVFKVMRKVREQEKPLGLGAACGNECSAALARFGNMRRRQFRRDHLVRDFGDAAHCPCRHDSIDIVILNGNGRRRAFNEP
jgi:hypothetical protein